MYFTWSIKGGTLLLRRVNPEGHIDPNSLNPAIYWNERDRLLSACCGTCKTITFSRRILHLFVIQGQTNLTRYFLVHNLLFGLSILITASSLSGWMQKISSFSEYDDVDRLSASKSSLAKRHMVPPEVEHALFPTAGFCEYSMMKRSPPLYCGLI